MSFKYILYITELLYAFDPYTSIYGMHHESMKLFLLGIKTPMPWITIRNLLNHLEPCGTLISVISDIWCFEPLWKIWTSIGMIIPNIWENKKWQPNHQPVYHGQKKNSNHIFILNPHFVCLFDGFSRCANAPISLVTTQHVVPKIHRCHNEGRALRSTLSDIQKSTKSAWII